MTKYTKAELARMQKRFTAAELIDLPTLAQGQADNLKLQFEDAHGHWKVWLCRAGVEDGMPYDNQITLEHLDDEGRWITVAEYPGGPTPEEAE